MYLVLSSLSLLPLPEISINLKGNSRVQFLFPLFFPFPLSDKHLADEGGGREGGGEAAGKKRKRRIEMGEGQKPREEGWERVFFVGKRKRYRIPCMEILNYISNAWFVL